MSKIKLFLDEDVHLVLSRMLQKRGFDVLHAQELDRKGRPDADQLAFAIQKERALLSFNVKDYVVLHNYYMENDLEHFGIFVSKQIPVGEALKRTLIFLQAHRLETVRNQLLFLPPTD